MRGSYFDNGDGSHFAWASTLRDAFPVIREEVLGAMSEMPNDYKQQDGEVCSDETIVWRALLHSEENGWDWNSYIQKGVRHPRFAAHCPRTVEILESIPGLLTGIPFGYAFVSRLKPHGHIHAHHGPCNLRIRCHFPLVGATTLLEEVAGLLGSSTQTERIEGDEAIQWKEGEPLLFDDTYEHEVWNTSDSERVLLLFDVWHPDLSEGEREALVNMFHEARDQGWIS